jgi:hypothetical protein
MRTALASRICADGELDSRHLFAAGLLLARVDRFGGHLHATSGCGKRKACFVAFSFAC